MNYLNGTIDRFEENQAIIKLENGTTLLWPKEKIPDNLKEGELIKLLMQSDKTETNKQEETAKNILNEILQNE